MGKLTPAQIEWSAPDYNIEPGSTAVAQDVTDTVSETPERSTLSLAFELENPVYNFVDYLSSPTFEYDPNFTTERYKEKAATIPWFDEYSNEFVGVKSEAEFDYVADRLSSDIEKRQELAARGWAGTAAAVAAGLASPTVLLPLVGQARGLQAVATGAGYGLLAAGVDEIALQMNRPGRTTQETAIAVGASTILGGLLGGLVRNLPAERMVSVQVDIEGRPRQSYISPSVPSGPTASEAGAMVSLKDPGPLANALGGNTAAKWFGPIMRGMRQNISDVSGSVVHRNAVAQLGDGGLVTKATERGISPTEGLGTIENRITTYHVHEWKLDRALSEAYQEYMGITDGMFRGMRAQYASAFAGDGRLTFGEFKKEFTRAMYNDGVSPAGVKQVEAISKEFRRSLDEIFQAGQKAGIYGEGDEAVLGDLSYWTRQWDSNAVANKVDKNGRTFVDKLSVHIEQKYLHKFNELADKLAKGEVDEKSIREELRSLGAENLDFAKREADFREIARQTAEEVQTRIMGSGPRMAQFEMKGRANIPGRRGAELSRVLDVNSLDFEDFIEMDPQVALRRYIRTLAPDIEIAERFGDPNMSKYFDDLESERQVKAANIEGKDWSPKKKEKELTALNAQYEQFANDTTALLERLKHTRGLPNNPNAWLQRAGRVAMGLNTLRFMGSVVPSSVADVGRVIFKHGYGNAFKYAFRPLIKDLKGLKLSAREAKYAGNALDALNHRRALAMMDMFEDFHRRSKFEQAVDYGASRIGMIAGFDYWTSAMKMIDTAIVNGRVMDAISRLDSAKVKSSSGVMVLPSKLSRQNQKDLRYLAELGLDEGMAERIWKQMDGLDTGGGGKTKAGTWLPNTESWTDEGARKAYRTAINRSADATITTPGIERPLTVDSGTIARMLFQFKSFVFSSTTRTLLAGLQQRDANAVQGILTSLAMGAASYAIYMISIGKGDELEDADYGKIMDEAIDRSGLLGVFSLGQQLLQRIPATAEYTSFAGQRTTRRASQELLDLAMGPSYNMGKTVSNILMGLDEPTESTLHQLRLLLPYQNVFYARWILSQLEEATGEALDLPETRR